MSSGKVRAKTAKEVGIGDGKVIAIVNELRANRDYYDIYLLRPLAGTRRKETEDLGYLAFSIRLRKIIGENSLSEDHLNLQELNLVQTYLDPYKGS